MKKELKKNFPTQGRTTTNKEGIYSKPEVNKAKDHKKERGKEQKSKATKANSAQKQDSWQKVKEDAHSWLYKTHPWPAKDKDQRSTNRDPSSGFFSIEKNPEKARGLQVPTTEKHIFKFFDPPAFCNKKQKARGLHSMSAIFAKLHSLHSKEKEPGGHQAKVHISQKKNQRRPS